MFRDRKDSAAYTPAPGNILQRGAMSEHEDSVLQKKTTQYVKPAKAFAVAVSPKPEKQDDFDRANRIHVSTGKTELETWLEGQRRLISAQAVPLKPQKKKRHIEFVPDKKDGKCEDNSEEQ